MATSNAINNETVGSDAKVDMKFEVVVIPVADVDRSKAFYTKLGWRLDADFPFDNGFRVVQFTPPGVRVLRAVRHEDDDGHAGFCPGPLPDRLRCRSRAQRTHRLGCRGQ